MSPVRTPVALLEKLGASASAELNELLETQQRTSTEAVMSHCANRFERRLVEETSKLRVDMAQMRGEMREGFADVRGEMRQGFADVRRDIATSRFELLRWSFAFWVGQLAAVAAIVGLLPRTIPGR